MKKEFEILYNSDIIIHDRGQLAALCIFYDKVLLPWDNPYNPDGLLEIQKDPISEKYIIQTPDELVQYGYLLHKGKVVNSLDMAAYWHEENALLFKSNIIDQAPYNNKRISFPVGTEITVLAKQILKTDYFIFDFRDPNKFYLNRNLVKHLIRSDLNQPGIFSLQRTTNRETYKYFQAEQTFKYLLPKLNEMHVEEILSLREKVKDTREGFSLYLQTFSTQIEEAVNDGWDMASISYEAQKVIETHLMPCYYEFKRQLGSEKLSTGNKVLDFAEKFLSIDAAPWTPKFWGQIVGALKLFYPDKVETAEELTNERQAYKFMHICEG